MNKPTTRVSEEDLWHWAERRKAQPPIEPGRLRHAGLSAHTAGTPEPLAKRWLAMLGFSQKKRR